MSVRIRLEHISGTIRRLRGSCTNSRLTPELSREVSYTTSIDPLKGLCVRGIPIYTYPLYDIPRGRRFGTEHVPINKVVAPISLRTR